MKSLTTIGFLTIALSFNLCSQNLDFSNMDFRKADSVAQQYAHHSLYDLKALATKLTNPFADDVEKFRAIYYWVCNTIESDYEYYLWNEKEREKFKDHPEKLKAWNDTFSKRVYKRLLDQNKTVCTGYAYLIRELSYWAGLTSVIVDGYGRSAHSNVSGPGTPNHSWNAIQLNEKWYLCDATWSSGTIDPTTGSFTKKFDPSYFLPSPILFARNHYPLDTSRMLLDTNPLLRDFLDAPIVYKAAYKYNINPTFPSTFIVSLTKGEAITICFQKSQKEGLESFELKINGSIKKPILIVERNGQYCVEYTFKNRGNYTVHALLNSEYLFTYRIHVR